MEKSDDEQPPEERERPRRSAENSHIVHMDCEQSWHTCCLSGLSTIPHRPHGPLLGDGDKLATPSRMKETSLTIPEIGLIASTRVALGAGLGLLVSDRLNKDQRKGAGWALFGIGVLSTIPIVVDVIAKRPVAEKQVPLAA